MENGCSTLRFPNKRRFNAIDAQRISTTQKWKDASIYRETNGNIFFRIMSAFFRLSTYRRGLQILHMSTKQYIYAKRSPIMLPKKNVLLHDNYRVHKAHKVQGEINNCGFVQLRHSPYSLDFLWTITFFVSCRTKSGVKIFWRTKFVTVEE